VLLTAAAAPPCKTQVFSIAFSSCLVAFAVQVCCWSRIRGLNLIAAAGNAVRVVLLAACVCCEQPACSTSLVVSAITHQRFGRSSGPGCGQAWAEEQALEWLRAAAVQVQRRTHCVPVLWARLSPLASSSSCKASSSTMRIAAIHMQGPQQRQWPSPRTTRPTTRARRTTGTASRSPSGTSTPPPREWVLGVVGGWRSCRGGCFVSGVLVNWWNGQRQFRRHHAAGAGGKATADEHHGPASIDQPHSTHDNPHPPTQLINPLRCCTSDGPQVPAQPASRQEAPASQEQGVEWLLVGCSSGGALHYAAYPIYTCC